MAGEADLSRLDKSPIKISSSEEEVDMILPEVELSMIRRSSAPSESRRVESTPQHRGCRLYPQDDVAKAESTPVSTDQRGNEHPQPLTTAHTPSSLAMDQSTILIPRSPPSSMPNMFSRAGSEDKIASGEVKESRPLDEILLPKIRLESSRGDPSCNKKSQRARNSGDTCVPGNISNVATANFGDENDADATVSASTGGGGGSSHVGSEVNITFALFDSPPSNIAREALSHTTDNGVASIIANGVAHSPGLFEGGVDLNSCNDDGCDADHERGIGIVCVSPAPDDTDREDADSEGDIGHDAKNWDNGGNGLICESPANVNDAKSEDRCVLQADR